ncbi:hypothetical protein WDW37_16525 [Bdellovibrionota bacterium FG-1]
MSSLTLACGNNPGSVSQESPAASDTSCVSGQAQIAIRDGFLQNLCGCNESAGQLIPTQQGTLICTVPSGVTVFFHYLGTSLKHEIVSTGSPAFLSSPPSDPKAILSLPTHVVQFANPGTYSFEDAFDTGLQGQIIVH